MYNGKELAAGENTKIASTRTRQRVTGWRLLKLAIFRVVFRSAHRYSGEYDRFSSRWPSFPRGGRYVPTGLESTMSVIVHPGNSCKSLATEGLAHGLLRSTLDNMRKTNNALSSNPKLENCVCKGRYPS